VCLDVVSMLCSNDEIASCFNDLDKDGNGVLSPQEVVDVATEF